jgi:hypothetical protein
VRRTYPILCSINCSRFISRDVRLKVTRFIFYSLIQFVSVFGLFKLSSMIETIGSMKTGLYCLDIIIIDSPFFLEVRQNVIMT